MKYVPARPRASLESCPFAVMIASFGEPLPRLQLDALRIVDAHDAVVLAGLNVHAVIGDFVAGVKFGPLSQAVHLPSDLSVSPVV